MRDNILPYPITEPPTRLKKARLDNTALVPASLLLLKETYISLANTYPTSSVLCIQGTQRQQKIMAKVTIFFRDHGRQVFTMPMLSSSLNICSIFPLLAQFGFVLSLL